MDYLRKLAWSGNDFAIATDTEEKCRRAIELTRQYAPGTPHWAESVEREYLAGRLGWISFHRGSMGIGTDVKKLSEKYRLIDIFDFKLEGEGDARPGVGQIHKGETVSTTIVDAGGERFKVSVTLERL